MIICVPTLQHALTWSSLARKPTPWRQARPWTWVLDNVLYSLGAQQFGCLQSAAADFEFCKAVTCMEILVSRITFWERSIWGNGIKIRRGTHLGAHSLRNYNVEGVQSRATDVGHSIASTSTYMRAYTLVHYI